MDTRTLRMEETEHGFAIHDTDTDNEDRIGYVEMTGDSLYDEQERFPLAIELVHRWNAYPEAELRIRELINACEELLRHANGIRGEWADPLGTAEDVMNEAKSFRAAIANATNTH